MTEWMQKCAYPPGQMDTDGVQPPMRSPYYNSFQQLQPIHIDLEDEDVQVISDG